MNLLTWLLVGAAAGALAKMITPQDEKGGWISSLIVGLIGSTVGGFLAGLIGIDRFMSSTLIGSLILAVLGALVTLYVYHKYLKHKMKVNL